MKPFSILILLVLISISCSEDAIQSSATVFDGKYEGVFIVVYNDEQTFSNPVRITFDGELFSSSAGPERIPAGGNGTFEVRGNEVEFIDENFWTADFDWGLILSGTYTISETRTQIELVKKQNEGDGYYQYKLQKKVVLASGFQFRIHSFTTVHTHLLY